MSLALVQAGVGSALHIGVEQPVDDAERSNEERSFDPSDFAESDGQFVLARIGRELSQQLARRKGATGQGGSNPQDVRPVPHDHVRPDFIAGSIRSGVSERVWARRHAAVSMAGPGCGSGRTGAAAGLVFLFPLAFLSERAWSRFRFRSSLRQGLGSLAEFPGTGMLARN